jgi:hypothetical protein
MRSRRMQEMVHAEREACSQCENAEQQVDGENLLASGGGEAEEGLRELDWGNPGRELENSLFVELWKLRPGEGEGLT